MPKKEWFQENPKVSAYLSPTLNQLLRGWMEKNGIKKTTQALTAILEEFLGVTQGKPIQSNSDTPRMEALEGKVESLSKEIENLSQALKQLSSNPKVDQVECSQIEHPGQLSFLDMKDKGVELKSSLNIDQSKPKTETQSGVQPKARMSTKELAGFLGWTESEVRDRRTKGSAIEGKGYRFNAESQKKKLFWNHEPMEEPTLHPEISA